MSRSRRRATAAATALVALATTSAVATTIPATATSPKTQPAAACSAPTAADEWPTFGRDLSNSRNQQQAGGIDPATAPTLAKRWAFSTGGAATGATDLNGTPIVAGGCVFLNTAAGDIIALDTATGAQRWRRTIPLDDGAVAGTGGIFVSSPAVTDGTASTSGTVIALVNQADAPYAIALDRKDGTTRWRSAPLVAGTGYYTNATPVVHDGLVLAGFSPAEGDPKGRGGLAILDAATGQLRKRATIISDADAAQGFAGAGVWTAPAIDTATHYAYVGTGNPYSKTIEHPFTNAIVKIDVSTKRRTFGQVVGARKGNVEQYDPVFRDLADPACEAAGEDSALHGAVLGNSAPCLQLDLDFGAPPNLFTDAGGRLLIGDLQKSGVYHVADARTMASAWSTIIGGSCAACNAAATAWDRNGGLYGVGTPGGVMVSLATDDGARRWVSPVADGAHYQSTTFAGGVVFTVDGNGFLDGFDAATGAPLVRRPLAVDVPDPSQVPAGLSSSGVAVASGLVLVAAGNAVIAFGPGGAAIG
jgi:outer membrane protein assembly factor BamB